MRLNFSQVNGALHVAPLRDVVDLSSMRLALQIGLGAAAPFALSLITDLAAGQPGAGFVVGGAFGSALIIRTAIEASQMDSEHALKLAHARALSAIEVREREAQLPAKRRPASPPPRPAIAAPVPDPEEEQRVLMAEDVRYIFEQGVRRGSFARSSFITPGKARLRLPSGDELSRPRFEQIISLLMADGLLIKGLNGSPTLPGQAGGLAAAARSQDLARTAPQTIGEINRNLNDTGDEP